MREKKRRGEKIYFRKSHLEEKIYFRKSHLCGKSCVSGFWCAARAILLWTVLFGLSFGFSRGGLYCGSSCAILLYGVHLCIGVTVVVFHFRHLCFWVCSPLGGVWDIFWVLGIHSWPFQPCLSSDLWVWGGSCLVGFFLLGFGWSWSENHDFSGFVFLLGVSFLCAFCGCEMQDIWVWPILGLRLDRFFRSQYSATFHCYFSVCQPISVFEMDSFSVGFWEIRQVWVVALALVEIQTMEWLS